MVSIIIPHFNRSFLLKDTIQSVLDQSINDWEIIIVDDNSQIEERKTIQAYKNIDDRISIYSRESAFKGPSVCRNEAVGKSKYPYLIFLDSDDLLKPFCLEQRIKFLLENPSMDMAIFLEENFNDIPGDLKVNFNRILPLNNLAGAFLQNNNPWQTMAPIWKKTFFEKIGGFDKDLLYMEDPELHIRALLEPGVEVKTVYDDPADCFYRIHHSDNTKKDFYYNSIKYRLLFYQKMVAFLEKKNLLSKYSSDVKSGLNHLNKVFLYSRKNEFPEEYKKFISLLKRSNLFTKFELMKIQFLMEAGNSQARFASALRLKGLFYRLLPA